MSDEEILSVQNVSHHFGGVVAVDDCSLVLPKGRIGALIGPNGAGKSTLLDIIAGSLPLQRGQVRFNERSVGGLPPHRMAELGLIRTFQVPRCFEKLTVLENLLVAPIHQAGESLFNAVLRPRHGRRSDDRHLKEALQLLSEFDLYPLRNNWASDLSGGQRRLLELARAMMTKAQLLLLDEPMAAVNPVLVARIVEHLRRMNSAGITLLLVEHNLDVVEDLCNWVTVMVQGRAVTSGLMAEVRQHQLVIDAYLGREVTT